jgi:hypothetical protein
VPKSRSGPVGALGRSCYVVASDIANPS